MEKGKILDENFSQKECQSCGTIMEKDWKFCPNCKTRKPMTKCQFCHKEIEREWNYCPFCKRNLQKIKTSQDHFQEENEWLKQLLKKE
ncbi:MAG: zinc ribbon domain-containing protein [Clostridia bacterium]